MPSELKAIVAYPGNKRKAAKIHKRHKQSAKECHMSYSAFARSCMNNHSSESFYNIIITSDHWKAWEKIAGYLGWDVPESTERGLLSEGHWKAFCDFIRHPKKTRECYMIEREKYES